MHFGENQLSPRSIGISPLPTAHPSGLQSTPVRASTPCYGRFTLAMGSSRGFGSPPRDHRPLQTRLRSGYGCHCLNLPRRGTRRIILQKARRQAGLPPGPPTACEHTVSGAVSLPSPGCFSPFPRGTVRYRSRRVVGLGRWAARLPAGLLVSGGTEVVGGGAGEHPYAALTPCGAAFQTASGSLARLPGRAAARPSNSYNPGSATAAALHGAGFGSSRFARHYYGRVHSSSGY